MGLSASKTGLTIYDAAYLGDLLDVNVGSIADGQTIIYDAASGTYIPGSGGGGTTIGSAVTGGTPNEILFVDASGNLAQSADLTFDDATNTLTTGKLVAGGTGYAADARIVIETKSATEGGLIVTPYADNAYPIFGFTNAAGSYNLTISANGYVNQSVNIGSSWNGGMLINTSSVNILDAGYNDFPVTCTSYNSTKTALIANGKVGQSVPIQKWQVAGSDVASISSNGGFTPASMADASAANGTIYYSTTAGKLVFKDSGGVVNALY